MNRESSVDHDHIDALTELVNIGIGRAANILSGLTDSHVCLSVPEITAIDLNLGELDERYSSSDALATVALGFTGELSGRAAVVFPPADARKLVELVAKSAGSDDELDTLRAGALCEVGNIVLNAVLGSMVNLLKVHLDFTVPQFSESSFQQLLGRAEEKGVALIANVHFMVEEFEIVGNILLVFEVGGVATLVKYLDQDLLGQHSGGH